jgi:transposase-like protein
MSKNAKKVITRENWVSNFTLIGKAKINDFSFKIDEKSNNSDWIRNSLNLGVDCGKKFGTVYCDMSGGYGENRENVIYVHGKDDSGNDDFKKKIEVDWDDRFNENVLEDIGDLSFITVGLEKTSEGKTFYKKFLSAYDAIAYIKEHLAEDMVINVKGYLKYSTYNDNVQVKKNITSIVLSKADDPSKYAARFTQTILIDKDSASLKNIDKDKSVIYVDARVLDYLKEYNGIEVKGQFPYNKTFEFEMDFSKQEQCKKIMEKVFKVKKGITQITFEGIFVEGGATVKATLDDISDDIKELIECGIFTEEEALARCSSNGSREQRMILEKPQIKLVGENKTPVVQKFEEQYEEDDLVLDYLYTEVGNDSDDDNVPFDTDEAEETETSGDDMDWLNNL